MRTLSILCGTNVTDLVSAVVQLLRRDMNELVETAREALEPIEPWDEIGAPDQLHSEALILI
jgi:hypothetical protein